MLVDPFSYLFVYYSFFFLFVMMEKDAKTPKHMILTSEWYAKHLFSGQNTQQWCDAAILKHMKRGVLNGHSITCGNFGDACNKNSYEKCITIIDWKF